MLWSKNKKRIGWIILKQSGKPALILEAETSELSKPGDFAWVKITKEQRLPVCVTYENFYDSERSAKTAYIADCKLQIKLLESAIAAYQED